MIIVEILKDNKGVALVITILVVTLLLAAAMEMNRKALVAAEETATSRDRITLSQMASSGIHIGMAILLTDKEDSATNQVDSVQEDWADPDYITEVLQEFPFEEGKLNLVIYDELGRIQVNALVQFPEGQKFNQAQYDLWHKLISALKTQLFYLEVDLSDDTQPAAIINSIKDWLDSGDDEAISGVTGAESDYYQDLDPSYKCRNGPFTHISELILVKGVDELFEGLGGLNLISNYMTVHGMGETKGGEVNFTFPGQININTASAEVISAMLKQGDLADAQSIVDYRDEKNEDGDPMVRVTGTSWYKTASSDAEIDPNLLIGTSDIYRIVSTAELNNISVATTAVVDRSKKNRKTKKSLCKVLSWETE